MSNLHTADGRLICILRTGGTPIPQKLGKISRLVQPCTLQISHYILVADGRDSPQELGKI